MRALMLVAALLLGGAACATELGEISWELEQAFEMTEPVPLATSYPWPRTLIVDNELGFYAAASGLVQPFDYIDGALYVTAKRTYPELESESANQPFTTGVVSTRGLYEQAGGRFEVAMKLSAAVGSRAVATLDSGAVRDEQRVVVAGGEQDAVAGTYQVGIGRDLTTVDVGVDLTTSMHSFGVVWLDQVVVWSFNGREVHREATPRNFTSPRHVAVAHAVGGNYARAVRPDDFPAVISIDHVRYYSAAESEESDEEGDPISSSPVTEAARTENDETPFTWEGLLRIIEHLRDVSKGAEH